MKRVLSFTVILCAIAFTNAFAQPGTCNSAFSAQTLPAGKVKFTPISPAETNVFHTWNFGDQPWSFTDYSPAHQYYANGVYTVQHRVSRFNPNGQAVCIDSTNQSVTVTNFCDYQPTIYSYEINQSEPRQLQFSADIYLMMPPDSIRWNFGDGTTSFDQNPQHLFPAAGTYNVCVRIKKYNNLSTPPCIIEKCKVVVVRPQQASCSAITPAFTTSSTGSPGSVQFTNTSLGTMPSDTVIWHFGDGTLQYGGNPLHTYLNPGNYYACITIKRPSSSPDTAMCVKEYCDSLHTGSGSCQFNASFTSHRDSTASGFVFQFTNTSVGSTNTDLYFWTFGDGTTSSTQNPTHSYAQPGTYPVCLRVQKVNPNGVATNCVRETCASVTAPALCNVQASWTRQIDAVNGRKVYFTNTTAPMPVNYSLLWTFGDGSSATGMNPVHEYALPGTYNVCLRITYGNCVATRCDNITITAPAVSCTQMSQFNFSSVASNNLSRYFVPAFPQNNVQYTWTFGDGTGSLALNPTHTYAATGNYTACLTAYKNPNCASTTCRSVPVTAPDSCLNTTLNFNMQPDSVLPNRVTFSAFSNRNMLSQTWSVTRIPQTPGTGTATLIGNPVTYVFPDTGWYRVCVRATFANNCVREYCREIRIAQVGPVNPACTSVAYPNPATQTVNMNITLIQTLSLNGFVYNSSNMLVAQHNMPGTPGPNVYSINVANLPAGTYVLKVWHGNNVCTAPFIKL